MLSDRRRKVLNALIEEYISTAMPVSSRAIVGNYRIGVSSATVRNELTVLEEDGYVISPHVSSGRIPTDAGYRTFVDELLADMEKRKADATNSKAAGGKSSSQTGSGSAASRSRGSGASAKAQSQMGTQSSPDPEIENLRESATELDNLLRETSRALNRFTDCLAIVMAPKITEVAIKRIALVSLDERHVIVVVAVKDGRVLNHNVELDHPRTTEEVRVIEELLNARFDIKGAFDPLTIANLTKEIKVGDATLQADLDKLAKKVEDCLLEEKHERVHLNGMEDLFSQPEMQSISLTMGFARLLDDDLLIFRLLGDLLASRGVSVRIGSEIKDETFSGVSVVSSSYGKEDNGGIVAIVGPTRMDYQKMIEAVNRASGFLDDTVAGLE